MQSKFREKFLKDISSISQQHVTRAIYNVMLDVESAKDIREIRNIKKLKNSRNAYRIRVGEYRIGIFLEGNVVEFTRCLHRKEIYRYFP
jgi:mRNA interferase RelE/StbE